MSPEEKDTLRKEVKHILIDHDLDRVGTRGELVRIVSRELGKPVNYSSLTMALSGYREAPRSVAILQAIKDHFARPKPCEGIHDAGK